MKDTGLMALPLLAKACTRWFCMTHSMQKLPCGPAGRPKVSLTRTHAEAVTTLPSCLRAMPLQVLLFLQHIYLEARPGAQGGVWAMFLCPSCTQDNSQNT